MEIINIRDYNIRFADTWETRNDTVHLYNESIIRYLRMVAEDGHCAVSENLSEVVRRNTIDPSMGPWIYSMYYYPGYMPRSLIPSSAFDEKLPKSYVVRGTIQELLDVELLINDKDYYMDKSGNAIFSVVRDQDCRHHIVWRTDIKL